MKKAQWLSLAALVTAGFITLLGCPTPTAPKPGTDDGNGLPISDNPTEPSSTGLYIYPYEIDVHFAFYVWDQTFTTSNIDGGGIKVTAGSKGWAGGSFANVINNTSSFNFSSVRKVKFQIRSSLLPRNIHFILNDGTEICNKTLEDLGVTNISSSNWTPVEIDVSAYSTKTIKSAFSFVLENDAGGGLVAGSWFDIKGIDWVDSQGNSVNICQ